MGQIIGAEAAEIIDGSPIAFSDDRIKITGPGCPDCQNPTRRGVAAKLLTAAPIPASHLWFWNEREPPASVT